MEGITEGMFTPRSEPEVDEEGENKSNFPPMSVLKMIALQTVKEIGHGEISRTAGPPKMKRPMECNRLESGPPTKVW